MRLYQILPAVLLAWGTLHLSEYAVPDLGAEETKQEKKRAALKKLLEEKATADKARADAEKKAEAEKAVVVTSTVKPAVPKMAADPAKVAAAIDALLAKQLAEKNVPISAPSSDAEFLRRVTLDIVGIIPSAERAQAFLDDRSPDKRIRYVEELLADSRYGTRQSDIWMNLIWPIDSTNRFLQKAPIAEWFTQEFNKNRPWNELVHTIMTATGDQKESPATSYFIANTGVDKMTDSVGKLFLGVQIQCAQCHNHPFTEWKQTEYWGLAQFFYNVNIQQAKNPNKSDGIPGVSETGKVNRKMNPLPESAKAVPAKFLGGETVTLASGKPARPVLADWMVGPTNPFFAKAIVNRTWAQYFGRGLVNPIDDMSEENLPTHPEVLELLTKELVASGYDLKHLTNILTRTEAYQRSSKPTGSNTADATLYSHAAVKVLTPEQLFDSLARAVGGLSEAGKVKPMAGAQKGGPVSARERFVAFFMTGENAKATDYEAGIPQALKLMNNPKLSNPTAVVTDMLKYTNGDPAKTFEKMYLTVLSRRPTADEVKKFGDYVIQSNDRKLAYADVMWALLNGSEFALNR